MKLYFTAFVILFLAAISRAEPTPEAVAAAKKAEIIAYVKGIQAEAKKAKDETASLRISNETIYGTTAKISDALIDAQKGQVAAIQESVKIQRDFDKVVAERDALKKSNENYKTFTLFVLLCVAGLTFVYAWQVIGKLKWFAGNPWSLYYRAGISLAVSGIVSYGLFYVITRLL